MATKDTSSAIKDALTKKLIERMEEGTSPWIIPWRPSGPARSIVTKKPYRGFNQLSLSFQGAEHESPYWLTYKQAEALGGNVKKGEKSTPIVFWKSRDRNESDSENNEIAPGADGKTPASFGRKPPLMLYYSVFNADQCENLKVNFDLHPNRGAVPPTLTEAHMAADDIMAKSDVAVTRLNGHNPCYVPSLDEIWMPRKDQFPERDDFYHVWAHEAAHSTGHSTRTGRLDRSKNPVTDMAKHSYAKEELVAEMAAAQFASHVGLDMDRIMDRSAAYIKGWAEGCKADPSLLINAAQQAQKAMDWMLGLAPEQIKAREAAAKGEGEPLVGLRPPLIEGEATRPEYKTSDHREYQAGDVVVFYAPGSTGSFETGVITARREENVTIGGIIDLPVAQVFKLATKEQARNKELIIYDPLSGDNKESTMEAARKWPHLGLRAFESETTGGWVCVKPKNEAVIDTCIPPTSTEVFTADDPAYRHDNARDTFIGQLHSIRGRFDLYASVQTEGKILMRSSSDPRACVPVTAKDGAMSPDAAVAVHWASVMQEARKEVELLRNPQKDTASMLVEV